MTLTPLALLLLLLTALGWSAFDLLRKLLVEPIPPLPLLFWLVIGQIPLFTGWWWWEGSSPDALATTAYWLPAAGSVLLNVVANIAFILAVQISPLSLTIPLLSLVPAFTTVLAIPLLGEVPAAIQMVGILLVVIGAILLHLPPQGLAGLLRALVAERGSWLMLVVALCWSLALPLDKMAIRTAGAPIHALVLAVGVTIGVLGAVLVRGQGKDLGTWRRAPLRLALAVVVSCVAMGAQLLAIQVLWVSLVETVKRGVGNALALVWGHFLLGETVTWASAAAVALMALGVVLIFQA